MESINKVVVDANAILRFLLNDNEEQAKCVSDIILQASCIIPIEVISEVVYVLDKVYSHSRKKICNEIKNLDELKKSLLLEREVVCYASELYANSNLDFVDCLINGYTKTKGYSAFTFDKKLRKFLGEKLYKESNIA